MGKERPIPENPWIDERGNLKQGDINYHLKVYDLLKCGCVTTCQPKAHRLVAESYKKAFKKEATEVAKETIVLLYQLNIENDRNNERGLKPLEEDEFTTWNKQQPKNESPSQT